MSFVYLYVLNFVDFLGLSILIPLMNPRIISVGGNLLWVGIIASLTSGAQLIGSPVVGSWSDSRGRKPVLIITLLFVLLSNSLLTIPSLLTLSISRIVFGFSHHTDTVLRTIIADQVPANDVSKYVNKMGALGGLAFMFGPLFGGILYENLQSFVYISMFLCAFNLATIAMVYYYVDDKHAPKDPQKSTNDEQEGDKETSSDFKKVLMNLKAINWSVHGDILLYKFLIEAAFNMLFMNMTVILTTLYSFKQIHVGYTISLISVTMVVCSLLVNHVNNIFYKNDVTGYKRTIQGFSAMTCLLATLCFANTSSSYIALIVFSLIVKVLLDAVIMEVLSSRTTDNDRGIIMGAFTSAMSLSGLVCPLISGVVGNFAGVESLTVLPIFPTVIALVAVITTFKTPAIKTE